MTPEEHDAAFAAVSHLPHLLAFAYFNSRRQPAGPRLSLARRPRLSRLHPHRRERPEVWRDILMANREEILKQTQRFRHALDAMEHVVKTGNTDVLEALIARQRRARGLADERGPPNTHR